MRYVYLYELDSVRKSDQQVIKGQQALFDEIVCNGNCVVLSLNQLTDSRAILSMLRTKQQMNTLLQLFQKGHLKYARFEDCRTPSYYIQKSIEEKRNFIYSSLPMKSNQYYLQKEVLEALKYADLSKFSDLIEKQNKNDHALPVFDEYIDGHFKSSVLGKEEALETLSYLKRFIEVILKISMYDAYALPITEYTTEYPQVPFATFMEHILSFESENALFTETKSILKEIGQQLSHHHKNKNSRSEWLLCLLNKKREYSKQLFAFAECIIHLCYNYTVEYSIYNVSKHYEISSLFQSDHTSFQNDFFARLQYEWKQDIDYDQEYLYEESNQFQWFDAEKLCPDWDLALRMIQKEEKQQVQENNIELYENDYVKRRDYQKKQNYRKLGKILAASLLSLIPIIIYTWIEDSASDFSSQFISQLFSNDILKVVFVFVAANLMTVIMEQIATVSNLWEIGKECKKAWKDFWQLSKIQVASYVNWNEIHHFRFEKKHKRKEQTDAKQSNLTKYQQLWEKRKEMFADNHLLPLVDPQKEYDILLQYELAHHTQLGVIHESPYYLHIVDLIHQGANQYFTYERFIPTVPSGAIVVVAIYQGSYLLLRQFRHAIRDYQMGFIRGFGETDITAIENVKKEIMEEIGGKVIGIPTYLGEITGDSGILGTKVSVYQAEIDTFDHGEMKEGIEEILLYTKEQLLKAIASKEIEDSFTLAAFTLQQFAKGAV